MKEYPFKRPIDLVASSVLLLALWPLLLIVAAIVRLDSAGPALFKQERIGRGEQPFEILKFRTMTDRPSHLIDQVAEKPLTSGADARITRVGKILRKTSLDELPQLVNILRGDMSLVGPRPILPEQVHAIPEGLFDRFEARPGVTGWAQVTGRRSLDWIDQLKADARYVEKRSLGFDIKILFLTIATILRPGDVYGAATSNWRAYYKSPTDEEIDT